MREVAYWVAWGWEPYQSYVFAQGLSPFVMSTVQYYSHYDRAGY